MLKRLLSLIGFKTHNSEEERLYRVNQATAELIDDLKERLNTTDKGVMLGALLFLEKTLDRQERGEIEDFLDSLDLDDEGKAWKKG